MKTSMKVVVVVALLVGLLTIPRPTILADTPTPTGTIEVSGSAEVRVVPDEVILILGIETWDKDLLVSKAQNDDRIKRLLAIAKDAGIDPGNIQTDFISIEPRYQDSYTQKDFIGFFVRKSLVITLKDLSKFEDLLTDSLRVGANYVQGIEFRTTELRKYRDQARALAIKAAKEKAIALAGELGQRVLKATNINETGFYWGSTYGSWWGARYGVGQSQNVSQNASGSAAPASDDSTIAVGKISVIASVSVSFQLVDAGN